MGCLRLDKEYERNIIKMSKKEKNKNEFESYAVPKSTIKVLKWASGGCVALFTITLGVVGWMAIQLYDLNKKALTEDSVIISDIKTDIGNITTDVKKITNDLNGDRGIYSRLAIVEEKLNTPTISASKDTQDFVDMVYVEYDSTNTLTNCITPDTCIGTDFKGNLYIAKDLIDEKILLTYIEDDKEVYFLGQYNEDYHWEGYCVTNTYYLDGTLYGICESNFDDGHRLDYKSFYVSEESSKEWIYANKTCTENENNGVNILCSLEYKEKKNFTNTNVRVTDIVYVDKFVEKVNPNILTYYFGNTSDGKYNDNTGNAYEIIYNDDKTVKTLYVGRFKNGTFNDDTGNAWDIAYSSEYNYYVYNTGKFKNGHAVNGSTTPIDIDRINDIILEHGQKFDIELKWKQD